MRRLFSQAILWLQNLTFSLLLTLNTFSSKDKVITLLNSTILYASLLYSAVFYSVLFYSTPTPTPLHSTLLYSTPLHSTLLHSTLLHSTPLHSTPLHSTPLYSTLLYSTPLYSTPLHSTLLCSALLCSAPTLFYPILFYLILFHSIPLSLVAFVELRPQTNLLFLAFGVRCTELQHYQHIELDMSLSCPGSRDNKCPHWDHVVQVFVCCDQGGLCGQELGRWITAFRR